MATFLTTKKMNPALAARIEASVSGRRRKPGRGGFGPRLVSVVRAVAIVALAGIVGLIVFLRLRDREALEQAREDLLEKLRSESASLTADDAGSVARVEGWLMRSSGAYEGDFADADLRAPGALARIVARPSVYVRGPIDAFANPAGTAEAAAASPKDAFLLCLVDRPASRAESALLGNVRTAYAAGGLLERSTANVRRLDEAIAGLPVLLPEWALRVRSADNKDQILRLRKELERAPVARAKLAARAALLVFAMDEPGALGGLTELDGERPHDVRVGLVDLVAAKVLLRLRKHVDPSWISVGRRAEYARGLDGCALAFDVREGL